MLARDLVRERGRGDKAIAQFGDEPKVIFERGVKTFGHVGSMLGVGLLDGRIPNDIVTNWRQ